MSIKKMNSWKVKKQIVDGILLLILTIGAVVMAMVFVWMVLSAFKTSREMFKVPPSFLPESWSFRNFRRVLKAVPFLVYFANSVWLGVVNTAVGVILASWVGYIFAKKNFAGKNILFMLLIAGMTIPFDVITFSIFPIMAKIGWTNSYLALTIPFFYNLFAIFFLRQYMSNFPSELIEAAKIDGYGEFGTFFRIVLPLITPALSAIMIILFLASWNSFTWPFVMIDAKHLRTLPIGLATFQHFRRIEFDLLMAASTMAVLPIITIFLIVQKRFIASIALVGVKG